MAVVQLIGPCVERLARSLRAHQPGQRRSGDQTEGHPSTQSGLGSVPSLQFEAKLDIIQIKRYHLVRL